MTHPDTLQRAAFEAWAASKHIDTTRDGFGGYESRWTEGASEGWRAAQAAAEPVTLGGGPPYDHNGVHTATLKALSIMLRKADGPVTFFDKKLPIADAIDALLKAKATPPATQAETEQHTFNDESPFCVKCGSTGEDAPEPVAHILPRDLKILKFNSMPVPVDPLPYDNGEEKTVPLYTAPPATQADNWNEVGAYQAALTAALEALKKIQLRPWHSQVRAIADAAIAQIEALKGPTP